MTFSASSRITNGAIVFSTDEFRSKVACMNELVQLKCNPHSRIAVYSASFGRTQYESIQCPQPQGVPEESKSKVKETSFYPSLIFFLRLIHTDGLTGDTKQLFLSVVLFLPTAIAHALARGGALSNYILRHQKTFDVCKNERGLPDATTTILFLSLLLMPTS